MGARNPEGRHGLRDLDQRQRDGGKQMKIEPITIPPMPEVKPAPSKRAAILHEAEKCICGQREQDYGSPESNFGIIANLWSDYLDVEVTALDVSMMMVLLKVARIKNGGGTGDSFVDIAGYAACGGEIHESTT